MPGAPLIKLLTEQQISHALLPPIALAAIPSDTPLTQLKTLLVGGDACSESLVQQWAKNRQLINAYGPTEATVYATTYHCNPEEPGHPPIGHPIANTQIYILDAHQQPVPLGVAGEIHIGGIGVARGYLNRPELTAERFIPNPFHSEGSKGNNAKSRLYKTGDLGRWRADGAIEYLGRNDHQVKIRGFRIELGEIEAQLARNAHIKEAIVLAREDRPGDKRLIAYLTVKDQDPSKDSDAPQIDLLRQQLKSVLPEYMLPSAYIILDSLPLTPNGKLDRKALPAPESSAWQSQDYIAPQGELEETLADLWQTILHLERIGRHDNFFDLGGHSLLAVQVIARIRQTLGIELPLKELFEHPELAELARSLQHHLGETNAPAAPAIIPQADRSQALPLSWTQQRLWFLDQLEGEGASSAYHIPGALKLSGTLDTRALQRALDSIVARHEILRTTFRSSDGAAQQIIAPEAEARFTLRSIDLSEVPVAQRAAEQQRQLDHEAQAPFDLSRSPLIRGLLLKTAHDEHTLCIVMHHIISDGWSIALLIQEFVALYKAYQQGQDNPLPPLTLQYGDYAVWQRDWLQGERLQEQLNYWQQTLAGAPALLELPLDRPRPQHQSYAGASVSLDLGPALSSRLKTLARRHDTTLFMTLSAGWAILLSRLSHQSGPCDIVIGAPVANRPRAELSKAVGKWVFRGDLAVCWPRHLQHNQQRQQDF